MTRLPQATASRSGPTGPTSRPQKPGNSAPAAGLSTQAPRIARFLRQGRAGGLGLRGLGLRGPGGPRCLSTRSTGITRFGRLGTALIAVLAVGLAGCATQSPRNPDGQVTTAVPADAFSLQVGDCAGPLTTGTVGQVTLIPCAEPHAWEVFAVTELPGEEFPGANEVQDLAEAFCNDEFKAFIGVSVAKSEYRLTVLQPTKQTWSQAGDRQVTCLAGDGEGKVEGSLSGAKK